MENGCRKEAGEFSLRLSIPNLTPIHREAVMTRVVWEVFIYLAF